MLVDHGITLRRYKVIDLVCELSVIRHPHMKIVRSRYLGVKKIGIYFQKSMPINNTYINLGHPITVHAHGKAPC